MMRLWMIRVFLVALCGGTAVTASITFVGTSTPDLEPSALPEELTVNDTESVVRRTELFRNHYAASVQTDEEYVPGQVETEVKPGILLVRGSPVPADGSVKSSPFGFVGTAVTAYGYHQNLTFSPDHVWITILSQFSYYVNARSELLRNEFVNFEGQRELNVTVYGYNVYNAPYDEMTREFLSKISENLVDETVKEWFLPGFSTTTETDEVVAAATAMCTFQDYFTYVYAIVCGIPTVTMEGTVQDWELLASKVERLLGYDDGTGVMIEWVDLLRLVLGNFVESARNGSTNNLDFWDNICYYNSDGYGTSVLSGWMTVFTFFDKDGQKTTLSEAGSFGMSFQFSSEEPPRLLFPSLDQTSINPNILSCPAIVDDNGTRYNATLFVGQMSFSHLTVEGAAVDSSSDGMVIRPRNDWALVIEEGEVELERPSPDEDPVWVGTEVWDVVTLPADICFWYDLPPTDDRFLWGGNSSFPRTRDPTPSPTTASPTPNSTESFETSDPTPSPTTESPTPNSTDNFGTGDPTPSLTTESPTPNSTDNFDADGSVGFALSISAVIWASLCFIL